jgi:hypothetical protein
MTMTADPMAEARAALHLDVPCRKCGVGVSQPCLTPSGGHLSQVHAIRLGESGMLAMMDPLFTTP